MCPARGAVPGPLGELLLHDPVFERVVREHEHPPAGGEEVHGVLEAVAQVRQLAVDLHADRLEGAAGRVATGAPGRRRDRRLDRVDELAGGRQRPAAQDLAGDAPGEPLLAVALDDANELGLVVVVDHVGGRQRLGGVHPHVERRVGPVREAALGPVQLWAAHTQVEQHSHDVPLALGFCDLGQVLEAAVHDPGPFAEASECLLCRPHRHRIPVDAEEPEVGTGVEQEPGMPTAAGSGVDDRAGRNGQEQVDHFPAHDRTMDELRTHLVLPRVFETGHRVRHRPPGRTMPIRISPRSRLGQKRAE